MTSATQSVFAAMSGEPQSAEEIGRRCDPPVFRTTVSKTLNATHIPVRSKIARRESYRTTHGDTLSTSLTNRTVYKRLRVFWLDPHATLAYLARGAPNASVDELLGVSRAADLERCRLLRLNDIDATNESDVWLDLHATAYRAAKSVTVL
jgi:hypothetical protein